MNIYNKIIPFIKGLLKAHNRKKNYTKQLRKIDKRNHMDLTRLYPLTVLRLTYHMLTRSPSF